MPTRSSSTLELSATFANTCVDLLALLLAIWQGKPINMFLFFFNYDGIGSSNIYRGVANRQRYVVIPYNTSFWPLSMSMALKIPITVDDFDGHIYV